MTEDSYIGIICILLVIISLGSISYYTLFKSRERLSKTIINIVKSRNDIPAKYTLLCKKYRRLVDKHHALSVDARKFILRHLTQAKYDEFVKEHALLLKPENYDPIHKV